MASIGDNFEEITVDSIPSKPQWRFVRLYKISVKGNTLIWQVGFDGVNQLLIWYGYEEGSIQLESTEVVPKVNRTMLEQALQEARQRYKLKIHDNYTPGY